MFSEFFKKIQNQILLLLFVSTLVPVSVVGGYNIFSSTWALSNLARTQVEEQVTDDGESITEFLDGLNQDILFLSKTPPLQGIIRAKDKGGIDQQDNSSYDEWISRLQTIFVGTMEAKPYYYKLRYIDEDGDEVVRVNNLGDSQIEVVAKEDLQNKKERPFFIEGLATDPDTVDVSRINLNQDDGVIETPYVPVIRYSTPVVDSAGRKRGIVISNVYADKFLEFAERTQGEATEEGKNISSQKRSLKLVINQDGYYLSHPDPGMEWGFDLGKEDATIQNDYPEKVVEQILSNEQGLIEQGTENILAYQRVVTDSYDNRSLIVLSKVDKGTLFASVNSFKIVTALITVVSLAAVLSLGIFRSRQLVEMIKQLINNISTSSQQIYSTLEQQERLASQQAASVSETTTTMDELEASCRHSSEQALAAADAARYALEITESGSGAVGETKEGMYVLEQKVDAIAEKIVRLSQQAEQIGSISELVSDLANQTNMLALNSSVEAVRAGEHGKGFTVVANEIRKLSDQSQKSAEKIGLLVSDIQKAISTTVMVTEEGTKTVAAGVKIAEKTDHAFSGVAEAVNKVVFNNQQISLNLKQQLDAMEQVVEAMESINKGSKETAAGINQTKTGTQQLKDAAFALEEIV